MQLKDDMGRKIQTMCARRYSCKHKLICGILLTAHGEENGTLWSSIQKCYKLSIYLKEKNVVFFYILKTKNVNKTEFRRKSSLELEN